MQRHVDALIVEAVHLVALLVPDRHVPGAIGALGDLPLEGEVLERVVLGADGEAVLGGVERQPLGHRPRDEHSVPLEPKVPVEAAGVMLLDHEARIRSLPGGEGQMVAVRLGRLPEVTLPAVRSQ